MNILHFLLIFLSIYLLEGVIVFCLFILNSFKYMDLKLTNIKEFNFSITVDDKEYEGLIGVILFILLWPSTFNLKKE